MVGIFSALSVENGVQFITSIGVHKRANRVRKELIKRTGSLRKQYNTIGMFLMTVLTQVTFVGLCVIICLIFTV